MVPPPTRCNLCCPCSAGLVCGIIAWLVTCQCLEGRITIDLLGGDYPMLAGAVMLFSSILG